VLESRDSAVETARSSLYAARVVSTFADPSAVLVEDLRTAQRVMCELLVTTADSTPTLAAGDTVLVWSDEQVGRGVVIGRIGPTRAIPDAAPRGADPEEPLPDILVLEATQGLVLRVGSGSIELRADGKVLIKGTDLVSHAKRMNRIKGGAVSIN
jgi:hypothetical protein